MRKHIKQVSQDFDQALVATPARPRVQAQEFPSALWQGYFVVQSACVVWGSEVSEEVNGVWFLPAPADGTETPADGEATWSRGSSEHESDKCRPCVWYWKSRGCTQGTACDFCHLCGPEMAKIRRQQKIRALKEQHSNVWDKTKRPSTAARKTDCQNLVSL